MGRFISRNSLAIRIETKRSATCSRFQKSAPGGASLRGSYLIARRSRHRFKDLTFLALLLQRLLVALYCFDHWWFLFTGQSGLDRLTSHPTLCFYTHFEGFRLRVLAGIMGGRYVWPLTKKNVIFSQWCGIGVTSQFKLDVGFMMVEKDHTCRRLKSCGGRMLCAVVGCDAR